MGEGQDHASKQQGTTEKCKVHCLETILVEESDLITRKLWLDSLEKKCARTKSRRTVMHKVPGFSTLQAFGCGRAVHGQGSTGQAEKQSHEEHCLINAYSEETNNDHGKWEEMLFMDGCFVLHFIFCIVYDRAEDLKMKKYEIESVHHDLFLLENQLPYELLKILSGNDPELLHLICEYICMHRVSNDNGRALQLDEPVHLLDCLRTIIIGRRREPQHKLQEIQLRCPWPARPSAPAAGTKSTVLRPAKELTAKGIRLKPNRSGFSKDIHFKSRFIYGSLKLPRIIVDDATRPLFLNLAAYETCAGIDSVITSYICFLDSLVNHAEDIKVLQSAGILVNHLPTDEDAANLFNEMPEGLHPDMDAFMDVKRNIQKFFDDKTKASIACWSAECYHNHFKSPLTAMAVLAAVLALCLATTQTYFTIFPRGDK